MRLARTDALNLLREALATLPSELDARADFFVQWRVRTIQTLERIYPDRPEVVQHFKEIEFSPRRLTNKEARDEQLKLDAFLSGCVTARAQLEELVRQLMASLEAMPAPAPAPAEPPPQQPAPSLAPAADAAQDAEAPNDAEPARIADAVQDAEQAFEPVEPEPVPIEASVEDEPELAPAAASQPHESSVIEGARMNARELCAPVRSSLSRVLGAWERGDRDAALVLSAQLLAELTVLSRDDHFKNAFAGVVTQFVDVKGVAGGLDSLHSAAPLCVWSMVAAMNEVMKATP